MRSAGSRTSAPPTLILHGTEDAVVDSRNSGAARAPDPRRALSSSSPGAGHLFFWEQPERFVAAVEEFLL